MSGPEDTAPDRGEHGAGQQAEGWGARLSRARAVLAAQPFSAMPGAQLAALSADGVELRLPASD